MLVEDQETPLIAWVENSHLVKKQLKGKATILLIETIPGCAGRSLDI